MSHLCFGYRPNSGPCNGDYAAPLYVIDEDNNQVVAVGLMSFNIAFGEDNTCGGNRPDIATRLSSFSNWILEQQCEYADPSVRPAACDTTTFEPVTCIRDSTAAEDCNEGTTGGGGNCFQRIREWASRVGYTIASWWR